MEGRGKWTGIALDQLMPLCMPWEINNGQYQPPFNQSAAQLSLELAATAYEMEMDSWQQAGWTDISCLANHAWQAGEGASRGNHGFVGTIGEYLRRFAKTRFSLPNPIAHLRDALHPRENDEISRAVVMLHAMPAGRYLVAVGFMGTRKRFYDWQANFRMAPLEQAHQGFLELAREFQEKCDQIQFPNTAKKLGCDRLTLSDILLECRRPDSRFKIWMAGHSQGGAVMQLFTLLEMRRGCQRRNMIGYGFASPCALYDTWAMELSGAPLYHIMNSDDVTPRIGAALHAGRNCVFYADSALRAACYPVFAKDVNFRETLRLVSGVRETKSGLVWLTALFDTLESMNDSDAVMALSSILGRFLPDKLQGVLGNQIDDMLRAFASRIQAQYKTLTGEAASQADSYRFWRMRMADLVLRMGAWQFVRLLLQAMTLPHRLRASDDAAPVGTYQYIVNERFDEIAPGLWGGDAPQSRGKKGKARRAYPAGRFTRFGAARANFRRHSPSHPRRHP